MGEFKPEDELKPDASDRRSMRRQKTNRRFSLSSTTFSRQHLMIGIGVLVLLLLVIGIGSALQAPSQLQTSQGQRDRDGEKHIDLSSSLPMSGKTETPIHGESTPISSGQPPQMLSAPSIADTPTEAKVQPPVSGQRRIVLPGEITDALSQRQARVDDVSHGAMSGNASSLPTELGAVAPTTKPAESAVKPVQGNVDHPANGSNAVHLPNKPSVSSNQNAAASTAAGKSSSATPSGSGGSIQTAPANHFTLQLSGASRSDTLKAYAKQHNLTHSWVYETKRDGKSWYVLVNGVYASSAEARQAITMLPADVQAKKPWVKPIRQVRQDLNK